jgi:cyclohexyl-isocyanide hydratase
MLPDRGETAIGLGEPSKFAIHDGNNTGPCGSHQKCRIPNRCTPGDGAAKFRRRKMFNRRELGNLGLTLGLTTFAAGFARSDASVQTASPKAVSPATGGETRLQVAALIYPNMIMLDLTGPMTVFNIMRSDVHLVAKTMFPVATDIGIPLLPTRTFADGPADIDVLFVPGGLGGTVAAMNDAETVEFTRDRGNRARLVTSVCTGSLLLGAAGLLAGYDATSHWYVRDLLPLMGAKLKTDRVVIDRNRITGGGVTAGIDFGLEIARQIRGEEAARLIQLLLEYDPKPPFDSGSPERAGPELTTRIRGMRGAVIASAREAATNAKTRLKL